MEVEQLPQLPHEIVVVILSRLPVKSLLQFKSVCKRWYFSISDPQFVRMHLNQVSRRREKNMLSSNPYELVNPVYFTEFKSSYGYHHPLERINFPSIDLGPIGDVYGSCNGLVLIVYEDRKLFLWNPFMREHREIPYPHWTKRIYNVCLYGLGYDSATDDYKLALLIFVDKPRCSFVIFVFSLKANRWKERIEICKYEATHHQTRPAAAVVNGALHWIMLDHDDDGSLGRYFKVVCFDLADEKLIGMRLPASLENADEVSHFLGVLGGCLCAVTVDHANFNRVVNVWVMKEYGVRESWTNLINFTYYEPCGGISPFCFTKGGDIVVEMQGKKLFLVVNVERKSIGLIGVSAVHPMPFTYMESLVSVYGSMGVEKGCAKRKR